MGCKAAARVSDLRKIHLTTLQRRLQTSTGEALAIRRRAAIQVDSAFSHLNPHATLARGYAIARDANGTLLRSSAQLQPGQRVHLQLARGAANAYIDEVLAEPMTPSVIPPVVSDEIPD